jgi:hypothetical protein
MFMLQCRRRHRGEQQARAVQQQLSTLAEQPEQPNKSRARQKPGTTLQQQRSTLAGADNPYSSMTRRSLHDSDSDSDAPRALLS